MYNLKEAIDRIGTELKELKDKIGKLNNFMELGLAYHKLDTPEQDAIEEQYLAMVQYKRALLDRLKFMKARLDD